MPRVSSQNKPTGIRDVAEAAGVSLAAVSLVLNKKPIRISPTKRKAIETAARRLGYAPHVGARRLVHGRMETIAILFPFAPSALSHIYLFELTREITNSARAVNHDVLLDFLHSQRPEDYRVGSGRVDGTLVVANLQTPRGLLQNLEESRHPHVVMGGSFLDPRAHKCVDCDLREGTRDLACHLIKEGHRRIAFIYAPLNPKAKEAGYREALANSGLPIHPTWIMETGLSKEDVDRTVNRVLRIQPRPTALMATNDDLAIRLIHHLQQRGLTVPGDFSVTGFDDVEIATLTTPSLTTVRIPTKDLAKRAVQTLMREIDRPSSAPVRILLPTKRVIRESSGPAPIQPRA